MDEKLYNQVIVNNEFDFVENSNFDISADYIILCEKNGNDKRQVYEWTFAGLTLAEWVATACVEKPSFVITNGSEKIIDIVKSHTAKGEYTVVLYADTPLVSKTHIKDLVGYVDRKRLNVCKLKRGYILKNEYIMQVDEIYSGLVYNLESDDFFEVKSFLDFDKVKDILKKRIFLYHGKNGVFFENMDNTTIDANIKIGSGTTISGGAMITRNSNIGSNVFVGSGSVIENSRIESDALIGNRVIIENSISKIGSTINSGCSIVHSVIGERTSVGFSSAIVDSAINDFVKIGDLAKLSNTNILERTEIGKASVIVGESGVVEIAEKTAIKAGTIIVR